FKVCLSLSVGIVASLFSSLIFQDLFWNLSYLLEKANL
ncbi:hypothetical protein BBUWI9123_0706, partial [Borreliella burgdorferi WI91-23]